MSIFINLDTMEYPRFDGDVALDPDANWCQIIEVQPPLIADDEISYTLDPKLIDGAYWQVWAIRKLTPDELETVKPHEAKTI
jgi:hypothetical protein